MTTWRVQHISGPAEELFNGSSSSASLLAGIAPLQPTLRFVTVDSPTLVLGSGQTESIVSSIPQRAPQFVRRRSGGGAVWLDSAEQVWVDVIVPTGHHLWSSDVTESFAWLGRAWVRTALAVGVNEPISIHVGRLESSDWSDLLCFAGRGPGEVFVRNRKLVGISQRRSRAGALFQCGILTRWTFDPEWFSAAVRPNTVDAHVMHAGIGLGELVEPLEPPDLPARIEAAFVDAVHWVDSQVDSQPSRSGDRPRGELASS